MNYYVALVWAISVPIMFIALSWLSVKEEGLKHYLKTIDISIFLSIMWPVVGATLIVVFVLLGGYDENKVKKGKTKCQKLKKY